MQREGKSMQPLNNYTKIVATIGPASESYETIRSIIMAGARVIRLNFSHGSAQEQQVRVDRARQASQELGIPIAIFQDLQGPKIRIGQLAEPFFTLQRGDSIILTTEECLGTTERISIDYPFLHEEAKPGNRILIDDGLIALMVNKVEGKNIHCTASEGGVVKPRKGVNLPGIPLAHLSSFTPKDEADLEFAFKNDLDYVALSFVRSANDVKALRNLMNSRYGREIPIISKVEKPEAVEDIKQIIAESGVIMVARGDLGVEMFPEEVPLVQKAIIRSCHEAGLPVITATQMLESMMVNPRPTRAETNDVANAVLDGTSAVMLSGETAAGKYPLQAVEIMNRVVVHTEQSNEFKRLVLDQGLNREHVELRTKRTITDAVGLATRELAMAIQASKIACFTHSGSTARRIAKFRPGTPIIAFSPVASTVTRLALSWGVTPRLIDNLKSVDELLDYAPKYLRDNNLAQPGEIVVITAGVPVGSPGMTNMIKVVEV
jgi:pyruvate kinase